MAIWPFNRNQSQPTDIPKEVQDYYQAEKREKVGIAGLLALGTLLLTIVLAMGLFFGGRWAYRTAFDNDDSKQVAEQTNDTDEDEAEKPAASSDDDSEEDKAEEDDKPAPAPSTPAETPEQPEANKEDSDTKSTDLPDTGPGDTATIFLSAIFFATAGYYIFGDKQKASR